MRKNILLSVVLLFAFSSCVTSKKYKDLESQYSGLRNSYENLDVKAREQESNLARSGRELEALGNELQALRNENRSLKKQYDDFLASQTNLSSASKKEMQDLLKKIQESNESLQQKEDELREKNRKYVELQKALENQEAALVGLKKKLADALVGFEGKGLTVVQKNGKVYVSVDEKLLFKSGKWDIEKPGLTALAEVSKVLANNPDINIVVEGHTDNVKYSGTGTGALIDNWDLSVKRATTVVRALLKNAAIDPAKITAAGRGEFAPVGLNDTAEGKQRNRRTEIILTPKFDEILNMLEK
jgi:chemotaxis protein MotB